MFVINFFIYALLTYLAWAVFYQLISAVAGHFFKKERGQTDGKLRRFAVLIPAYRDDAVIVESVKVALQQNYPSDLYEVLPIADQMWSSTVRKIDHLGVRTLQVDFDKSTKSKSLNVALNFLGDDYDAAVVLDADNHASRDFY